MLNPAPKTPHPKENTIPKWHLQSRQDSFTSSMICSLILSIVTLKIISLLIITEDADYEFQKTAIFFHQLFTTNFRRIRNTEKATKKQ